MPNERAYGIDLLKAISMFMVVVLHVLGIGGVLNSVEPGSPSYWTAWLLETAAFCAVNCFAIATGFLAAGRGFRYRKIVPLWLTVFFYTAALMAVAAVMYPGTVLVRINYLLPVTSSEYWYFTAYFGLFFFIPFLNVLVDHLSRRQHCVLLWTGFLLFCVTRVMGGGVDPFKLDDGYSLWWLMYLYLLGAGIKVHGFFGRLTAGKAFGGYAGFVVGTVLLKAVTERVICLGIPKVSAAFAVYGSDRWLSYLSPTILGAAVCFFLCCWKLQLPGWTHRPLARLSPLVFQVYIIHLHFLIWDHFMASGFVAYGAYGPGMLVLAVLGTALAIFALCVGIDWLRSLLFRVLRVETWVDRAADKLVSRFGDKTETKV